MWYPALISLLLIRGYGVTATTDLTEILGTLARQIVLKYFLDLPISNLCLGIITEDNDDILNYLQPLDIATYHIHLSRQEFLHSKRLGKRNSVGSSLIWTDNVS